MGSTAPRPPVKARTLAWPAAVAAVAGLHALAAWNAPPRVALDEVPDHLGERVLVGGRLRDVTPLDGAALVEVTDGSVYLPALLRGDPDEPVEPGDEARLEGIVDLYRGTHELRGRAQDLVVLETRDRPLSPSTVADDPRRFAGTPIRVEGWAVPHEERWLVEDPDAALAWEPEDPADLEPGARVVTAGTLAYDPASARYVLEDATWRRR